MITIWDEKIEKMSPTARVGVNERDKLKRKKSINNYNEQLLQAKRPVVGKL